jgi:hypothetical protein
VTKKKISTRAHRAVYEHVYGFLPKDRYIDHLCKVKCCVNPDHLEAVTHRENTMRSDGPSAINARKTHCIRGHELTPDNIKQDKRNNWRACLRCHREFYKRKKGLLT